MHFVPVLFAAEVMATARDILPVPFLSLHFILLFLIYEEKKGWKTPAVSKIVHPRTVQGEELRSWFLEDSWG